MPTQTLKFDVDKLSPEEISQLVSIYRSFLDNDYSADTTEELPRRYPIELRPAPEQVRPTIPQALVAPKTGWTEELFQKLLNRLRLKNRQDYADLLHEAIRLKGSLDRASIYAVMGWDEDRQMKGFTRPYQSALNALIAEDETLADLAFPVISEYDEEINGYQKCIGITLTPELTRLLVDFG